MTLVKFNNRPSRTYSVFDELFNAFPAPAATLHSPAVNIHETNEAFHLEFLVPGRTKDDFVVKAEKGLLTVSFEKEEQKSEEYKTIRREFSLKNFKRTFTIDENIDVTGIEGKYENGLLNILLPKKAQPQPEVKQIAIQ